MFFPSFAAIILAKTKKYLPYELCLEGKKSPLNKLSNVSYRFLEAIV